MTKQTKTLTQEQLEAAADPAVQKIAAEERENGRNVEFKPDGGLRVARPKTKYDGPKVEHFNRGGHSIASWGPNHRTF
jgi:hypothetical protein